MKATDPHRDGDVSAFWEFTGDKLEASSSIL
jgi:hypothetical protein